MICPECGSDLPDGFGRRFCKECKTDWRSTQAGMVEVKPAPRKPDTRFTIGPRLTLAPMIKCMVCHGAVEVDATLALVHRDGAKWAVKGPVCHDCEGREQGKQVSNKAGESVQHVTPLPATGFYLPGSRSHVPIGEDGVNDLYQPSHNRYWPWEPFSFGDE